MAVENRLTPEQLAALTPGDVVTVESGPDFGRRRHTSATVVRIDGSAIVVRCDGARGGTFVERYGLRDGLRIGRGNRAELVTGEPHATAAPDPAARIDAAYRAWARNRSDVEALRALQAAVTERLGE